MGTGKKIGVLMLLGIALAAPAAASAEPGLSTSVRTVHGDGATASAAVNVLTVSDQRRIDNRISAFTGTGGRLTLTAPEGLADPDGSGSNCKLDNAKSGESTAQEVSCAPGYIGAIVGDLGGGADSFDTEGALTVMIGAVTDGVRRPLAGGSGRDRLVGGAVGDLLDGGPGSDWVFGGPGPDLLIGGAGPDKLLGKTGRDFCRGSDGRDIGKSCEISKSIP
jgi:hypothetical protein